jgi:hypothetical protein
VPDLCDGAHKAGAGPVPSQGHAEGQSRPGTCSTGDENESHTLILGAGLASALLALAPAQAAPADPDHDAAIKACSTVNPAQPVTVLSAVNDGSGIGFSLVWMNDKDGNLWMCDADANGNVYT